MRQSRENTGLKGCLKVLLFLHKREHVLSLIECSLTFPDQTLKTVPFPHPGQNWPALAKIPFSKYNCGRNSENELLGQLLFIKIFTLRI